MKIFQLVFFSTLLFVTSCGENANDKSVVADSLSAKDSLKKKITEDLPPSEDYKQFEWIYSSFVAALTYNVKSTDVFIDKEDGLWVITSNGAVPQMTHVFTIKGVLNYKNDSLVPADHNQMVCTLRNEEIPKVDCDTKTFWNKDGCFTSENSTLQEDKIWDYAGLNDTQAKEANKLAGKVTRVVVNTSLNMRMYFMMKNGGWYLVFLDLRVPCSA